jgi:hypothetical protein
VACAAEWGIPVNPDVIRAQREGCIGYALGVLYYSENLPSDGDQVLALAGLVSPESQAAVAVLAFGNRSTLPPRCALMRLKGWMGVGPKVNTWPGKRFRFIALDGEVEDRPLYAVSARLHNEAIWPYR